MCEKKNILYDKISGWREYQTKSTPITAWGDVYAQDLNKCPKMTFKQPQARKSTASIVLKQTKKIRTVIQRPPIIRRLPASMVYSIP